MCTMATKGTPNPVIPCISTLLFTSYPTPSIDPHTRHQSTHILPTLPVHIFPALCFHHRPNFSNAGEGGILHRLTLALTFVGLPGWTYRRFPSRVALLSFLLSVPDFGLSIPVSRWDLVRPCCVPTFRLLHLLYNVYLFLDVRYAAYSSAPPPPPLPQPILSRSFPPPIGLPKRVFWSPYYENESIFLCERFSPWIPSPLWGIGWLQFS